MAKVKYVMSLWDCYLHVAHDGSRMWISSLERATKFNTIRQAKRATEDLKHKGEVKEATRGKRWCFCDER